MSDWVTIKIREDVYRDLLKLAGILQIKYERRVGLSEVIGELLTSVPKMKVLVEQMEEGEENE